MKYYFDKRWIGSHGIGRFASELHHNLGLESLKVRGTPTSPLDPLRLLFAMLLRVNGNVGVLSPGYNAPLFCVRRYIFTICDLNHIDCLENSSFIKRLYYRFVIYRAIHKATRILTISEFSRNRILEWSGVRPENVVNVGVGVDENYHPHIKPFTPGFSYLLCVSNRKAHKNEVRVVEAFSKAKISGDIRLLFTGDPDRSSIELCKRNGVEHRVVFMGKVAEEDLPSLYRGALALIFPSLYEGFGLPVIEAMACGTPVLTSNTTSLPEVAGDAAFLVSPLSVDEIANGINQLCSNLDLRELLIQKGFLQASRYKWDDVVSRVRAVINGVEGNDDFVTTN